MAHYQLAHINIARMLAPKTDPIMQDFINNLGRINRLAELTPGFVWRLRDEAIPAADEHVFEDDMIIVNLSVWEDIDSLHQYTYYSAHAEIYRRRSEWFEKLSKPAMVLWWVPAGHQPDLREARQRLLLLEEGPSPQAFNFKNRFPAEAALPS